MTPLPADVMAALTDPKIVTLTLYGETRNQPIEGQIAVGCVIRNRVEDGRWGSSFRSVCLARWQFSCWMPEGGQANHDVVMAAARLMAISDRLPEDPLLKQCAWIAQGVMGEWILDTVRLATHYYAPASMVPANTVPKWAAGRVPVAKKGQHLFFANVA